MHFLMTFPQEVLSMIRKKGFSLLYVSTSKRGNSVDFGNELIQTGVDILQFICDYFKMTFVVKPDQSLIQPSWNKPKFDSMDQFQNPLLGARTVVYLKKLNFQLPWYCQHLNKWGEWHAKILKLQSPPLKYVNILLRLDLNSHFHQIIGSGNSLFLVYNILDVINKFQDQNEDDRPCITYFLKI